MESKDKLPTWYGQANTEPNSKPDTEPNTELLTLNNINWTLHYEVELWALDEPWTFLECVEFHYFTFQKRTNYSVKTGKIKNLNTTITNPG